MKIEARWGRKPFRAGLDQAGSQPREARSAEELRSRGEKYERAAVLVSTNFETMGLLVYERIATFELVEKLAGGMIVSMWIKLENWQETLRVEQNQPSWAEWFQWLAQHMADSKDESAPAYKKYRDWRP